MEGGYVLDFSNRTFQEFFRDDVGVNIYTQKYNYSSGSKANYMRGFWLKAGDKAVGKSILRLIGYINTQIVLDNLNKNGFPKERVDAGKQIAQRLLGKKIDKNGPISQATFKDGDITISLQDEIFDHVQKLLNDGHYFNAVEEAYKITRKKLKEITGKERATEAFSKSNYKKIFGHLPVDDAEKDFFEGIRFLHMAIQFLRNEKAHTPATEIDKNLAIHYIALASLACGLINRK